MTPPEFFDTIRPCQICGKGPVCPIELGPALLVACERCWERMQHAIVDMVADLKARNNLQRVAGKFPEGKLVSRDIRRTIREDGKFEVVMHEKTVFNDLTDDDFDRICQRNK